MFFYGATPAFPEPLYLDIRVRERLRDGTDAASPSLSQLIARSAQGQRILLLGAAGAGKSTELLKLFFDCCSGSFSAPLRGLYAPLLLEARGIYDHLGHDTYEAFLHGLYDALELPQTISMQHARSHQRAQNPTARAPLW